MREHVRDGRAGCWRVCFCGAVADAGSALLRVRTYHMSPMMKVTTFLISRENALERKGVLACHIIFVFRLLRRTLVARPTPAEAFRHSHRAADAFSSGAARPGCTGGYGAVSLARFACQHLPRVSPHAGTVGDAMPQRTLFLNKYNNLWLVPLLSCIFIMTRTHQVEVVPPPPRVLCVSTFCSPQFPGAFTRRLLQPLWGLSIKAHDTAGNHLRLAALLHTRSLVVFIVLETYLQYEVLQQFLYGFYPGQALE